MQNIEYKPGQENEILDLFQKAYGKSLSPDFWQWRFKQNPFLNTPMINLMWDDSTLAGHYAVSAIEINIGATKHLASLSGTTMTHPDFEGRGIFTTLASTLYERVAEDYNVKGVLGFPNKNSHYGLIKKLNWRDLCTLPTLSIDASKLGEAAISLSTITEFTDRHQSFIDTSIRNLGFSVFTDRSSAYLNWRFIENPLNDYTCHEYSISGEIKGIIISKLFRSFDHAGEYELDILELLCAPEQAFIADLLGAVKSFHTDQEKSFLKINTWMSLFDPRHLLLERLGFSPGHPLTYMCYKSFDDNLTECYDPRNWYVSMGDSDVY